MDRDRAVLVAGQLVMLLLGCALALWGTFLIPLRWPGGVEGLAVVVAVIGNAAVCWLGVVGFASPLAGAMAGIGWLVTVLVLSGARAEGDVIILQGLRSDPGIGVVGLLFLFLGAAAALAGVVLGSQRLRSHPRTG